MRKYYPVPKNSYINNHKLRLKPTKPFASALRASALKPPPSDLGADTKKNLQNRLTRQRFGRKTESLHFF